jgi:hypothetical protein
MSGSDRKGRITRRGFLEGSVGAVASVGMLAGIASGAIAHDSRNSMAMNACPFSSPMS